MLHLKQFFWWLQKKYDIYIKLKRIQILIVISYCFIYFFSYLSLLAFWKWLLWQMLTQDSTNQDTRREDWKKKLKTNNNNYTIYLIYFSKSCFQPLLSNPYGYSAHISKWLPCCISLIPSLKTQAWHTGHSNFSFNLTISLPLLQLPVQSHLQTTVCHSQ